MIEVFGQYSADIEFAIKTMTTKRFNIESSSDDPVSAWRV